MPGGSSTPLAANLSSSSWLPPSSSRPSGAFPFPCWNTCAVFTMSSYLYLCCPSERAPSLLVRFRMSLVIWLELSHMATFSLCHTYFALRCSSKTFQLVFLTLTQSSAYFFSLNTGNINVFPHFPLPLLISHPSATEARNLPVVFLFDSCPSCVTGI